MKKLFLDDIRTIEMVYDKSMENEFDIVRNFDDFKKYIRANGLPEFISFDNDLGLDHHGEVAPDGYAAVKWLVYDSGLDLSKLNFHVHSANPVASEQIRGLLSNFQEHIRSQTFIADFEKYSLTIFKDNFSQKYDGLKKMVLKYNEIGLAGSVIEKLLTEYIGQDGISEYVDEVFGEVLNCTSGYTSPGNLIKLKE